MPGCSKASSSAFTQSVVLVEPYLILTNFFLLSLQGARKIVHELIFSSMLMETEYKRLFAIEFTKVNAGHIHEAVLLLIN